MHRSKEQSIVIVASLIKNQVRAMTERNVQPVFVGEADDKEVKYQLVFTSSESLLTDLTW